MMKLWQMTNVYDGMRRYGKDQNRESFSERRMKRFPGICWSLSSGSPFIRQFN